MYRQFVLAVAALLCGGVSVRAEAQTVPDQAPQAIPVVNGTAAAVTPSLPDAPVAGACENCLTIPGLTPVRVEVLADLGSKTSKSGETFPIRLAEPIVIDGREVIPAGATGMGEVVHAKRSGGSGAAGELVLAARYIDVDGRRLRLRSMRLATNGNSNIDTVNTLNIASAASPLPVGMLGFLIKGGQATVPMGTIADAKTAENFAIAPVAIVPASDPQSSDAAAPSSSFKEGGTNELP